MKNRPIRAPWPPSSSTRILHRSVDCVTAAPLRIRFERRFCWLSPTPHAVRLRLATDEPRIQARLQCLLSLRRCNPGDVLRSARYPCDFPAFTEPPGRHPPAPGSHSSQPFSRWLDVGPSELPRNLFCTQVGRQFRSSFHRTFRAVAISVSRLLGQSMGLSHHLRECEIAT